VDFLVIGSGAAGGVIAKELSVAGFSVVVLEQGPYLREKDFTHDEIKYAFQPALTNDTRIQPTTYRKTEAEKAEPLKAVEYGRQVGGGTVHFTATTGASTKATSANARSTARSPARASPTGPSPTPTLSPGTPRPKRTSASPASPERTRSRRRARSRIRCRRCR
jgi:hypothetical protein